MKNTPSRMLPLAALAMTMLSGCSNLGALVGQNQPVLSPAAKAAAEMPLEKDPVVNTQETYLTLVRQMQSKSLWYASIAHLDALDKQWGASSDSRLLRADALRQVGQLNAAVSIYQGLLGGAKDGAARYGLGRVAAELGDFSRAAQQMEQARVSNPVDPRLLSDLGYAYLRAGDLNAARLPLMQAAQLSPEDAQANVNLGLFMMVSGQNAQAEDFMRQRKMDAQTQQAIREQAAQWQQKAKQAAAEPAPQAMGKVVNVSRASTTPAQTAVAKAETPAAQAEPEPAKQAPAAQKPAPEPEVAKTPAVAVAQAPAAPPVTEPAAAPVTAAVVAPVAVAAAPLPSPVVVSQPALPQSVERASGGGQWMVSGSSFDSARPRHPGQFAPSVSTSYAYAAPMPAQAAPVSPTAPTVVPTAAPAAVAVAVVEAPRQSPKAVVDISARPSEAPAVDMRKVQPELEQKQPQPQIHIATEAPVVVAKTMPLEAAPAASVVKASEPVTAAPLRKAIAVKQEPAEPAERSQAAPAQVAPVQRAEPAPPAVVPRQPTGPARSLQEGAVVMAVASPAAVRQVGVAGNKQVQAMFPRSASAGGLFFETPDVQESKPATGLKPTPPERAWP